MKNMDRLCKGMLLCSLVLVVLYIGMMIRDWRGFQEYLPAILAKTHTPESTRPNRMFFSVALFESCVYLIPAFVLSFCALVMHFKENAKPRSKKMKKRKRKF